MKFNIPQILTLCLFLSLIVGFVACQVNKQPYYYQPFSSSKSMILQIWDVPKFSSTKTYIKRLGYKDYLASLKKDSILKKDCHYSVCYTKTDSIFNCPQFHNLVYEKKKRATSFEKIHKATPKNLTQIMHNLKSFHQNTPCNLMVNLDSIESDFLLNLDAANITTIYFYDSFTYKIFTYPKKDSAILVGFGYY